MKVLFDTSVLVPALVEAHPQHPRAFSWLLGVHAGEHDMVVASHTIAELYAVLTTLPVSPRMPPGVVHKLLVETVVRAGRIVALTVGDYEAVVRRLAGLGITGRVVYDALIARAAEKAHVDRLLTFDIAHFRRVWPEGEEVIAAP